MSEVKIELQTDSREYEVLYFAALHSADANGASVEIGVREGGGSEVIMRATHARMMADVGGISNRTHIGIDPWGNIPYILDGKDSGYHYGDDMRRRAQAGLHRLGLGLGIDVLLFAMRDTDYFSYFATGVPFYKDGEPSFIDEYSLVHFDGPHNIENVRDEMGFFSTRMSPGSWWVFDDVYLYDHASIEPMIFQYGFEPMDTPYSPARMNRVKASYRKA